MVAIYRSAVQVAGYCLVAVSSFVGVFGVQFVVNLKQSGGLLAWPYLHAVHPLAGRGFEAGGFLDGFQYLAHNNHLYITGMLAGLLTMRNWRLRKIFCLWALPLFLFFSGYAAVGASATRWLMALYGIFLAALVFAEAWRDLPARRRWQLVGLLVADILVLAPMHNDLQPRQWGMAQGVASVLAWVLPILIVPIVLWLCREHRRATVFVLVLVGLWHLPIRELQLAAMAIVLVRGAIDALKLAAEGLAKRKVSVAPAP